MRTNIVIEDNLMRAAMAATGLSTKRAVVEAGLELLLKIHAQKEIRELRGQIAWEGDLAESRLGRTMDDRE